MNKNPIIGNIENINYPEELFIDSACGRKAQILSKLSDDPNKLMKFNWSVNCHLPYAVANELVKAFSNILKDHSIDPYELQIRGSISHMDYTDFIVRKNKKNCKFRYGAIFTVREIDYTTYHWLILSVCVNGFIGARVIKDDFYEAILEMNTHANEENFSKDYWFKHGFDTNLINNAQLGQDGEIYSFSGNKSRNIFTHDITLSHKTMRKIELYMSNDNEAVEV